MTTKVVTTCQPFDERTYVSIQTLRCNPAPIVGVIPFSVGRVEACRHPALVERVDGVRVKPQRVVSVHWRGSLVRGRRRLVLGVGNAKTARAIRPAHIRRPVVLSILGRADILSSAAHQHRFRVDRDGHSFSGDRRGHKPAEREKLFHEERGT